MEDFIVIRTEEDLPPAPIDEEHYKLYVCVTKTGKTIICKYHGGNCWENANTPNDFVHGVIACKEIRLSGEILNIIDSSKPVKKVGYLNNLR